jgi:hypothetical protein
MRPWTRDDTKCWIEALEGRLEDITYYLDRTTKWCENNYVENDKTVFMCCFLTCIWVSQMRGESISFIELMEILGIDDVVEHKFEEKFYELDPEYLELDHEELLQQAVEKLGYDSDDED